MDALSIYEHFRRCHGAIPALLQDGPTLIAVHIKKVMPSSMVVTGSYMPPRDASVQVHVDKFRVEGTIGVRTDVQCAIKFLHPVRSTSPY